MVGGDGGGLVSGGRGVGLGLGVDSSSLIGDIGDISVITVAGVLHVLDSAVRKGNRVRSGDVGGTIGLLLSVEVGLGVVISDGVGEGVGGNLISIDLSRGVVSRGGVGNNGGVIGGGSMDSVSNDRGGMDSVSNSVMSNSVMGEANSVVGERGVDGVNSVGNNSISSVKSVGGISHDSGVGSEGLALGGGPVLSLVGLAHGLVAHLAVSVSIDWLVGAIVDGGDGSGHGGGQHRGVHSGVVTNHSMVSNSVVSEELGGSRGHGGKGETHKSLHVYLFVLRV